MTGSCNVFIVYIVPGQFLQKKVLGVVNVLLIKDPFKQRLERQISEYLDIVVELMGASFTSLAMQLRGKRCPQSL